VSECDLLTRIQTVLHNTKLSVSEYGSVIYVYRRVLLLAGAGCHGEERTPQTNDSDIHCILHLTEEAKKFIEKNRSDADLIARRGHASRAPPVRLVAWVSLPARTAEHMAARWAHRRMPRLHAFYCCMPRADNRCAADEVGHERKAFRRQHASSPLGLCGHVRVGARSCSMIHLLNGRRIGRLPVPLGPTVYGLWHLGIGNEPWHRLDRDEA
jgi:hypothetical protein